MSHFETHKNFKDLVTLFLTNKMTRKVVVVGDNLISLAIANAFARRSADFSVHLFTSRGQSTNGLKSINCNLTDTSKVDSLFEEIRPNVVIHW